MAHMRFLQSDLDNTNNDRPINESFNLFSDKVNSYGAHSNFIGNIH